MFSFFSNTDCRRFNDIHILSLGEGGRGILDLFYVYFCGKCLHKNFVHSFDCLFVCFGRFSIIGFVRYIEKWIKLINLFLSTRYKSKTNTILIWNYEIDILVCCPFYRNISFSLLFVAALDIYTNIKYVKLLILWVHGHACWMFALSLLWWHKSIAIVQTQWDNW